MAIGIKVSIPKLTFFISDYQTFVSTSNVNEGVLYGSYESGFIFMLMVAYESGL